MEREYEIIGACSGWGAQIRSCEKGLEDLIEGKIFERLKKEGIPIHAVELLYPDKIASEENIPLASSLPLIYNFNRKLTHAVQKTLQQKKFPIVIGGDHSIAVGTWNAFDLPFGLLWIDAHLDAHTDKTTPSGAYHGMPVAALLGYGLKEMAQLIRKNPVLKPQNLAYIGARSFEKEERDLLKELNVKIYFMDEVMNRGLQAIFPEAIRHITQGVEHYGVSLDLDVFSTDEAPGVGSPEKGGILKAELLPLLRSLAQDPRLLAFELVEFNPKRDLFHKTRELIYEILYQVMKA